MKNRYPRFTREDEGPEQFAAIPRVRKGKATAEAAAPCTRPYYDLETLYQNAAGSQEELGGVSNLL